MHGMIKEIQPKGEKLKTNMWNEKKYIYKGTDKHNTKMHETKGEMQIKEERYSWIGVRKKYYLTKNIDQK